ncbi:MAG: eukaryotic-like serine/threonine-protein kinase [Verrucomicrobiota bacterium]|jgi:serine/threonine protein kinase
MTDQIERILGNQEKCPQCGIPLGSVILSGLCPNCLLKQGLKGRPADGIETFEPPSLESLARTMDKVEPIEFIGRGGMGAVYKARQYILNRIVALKVMPPQAADGGSIIHRFEREARSLARLSHPNVVAVYDFGLADNFPYFVMDFVDGPSLRQKLKSGPLIPSEAVKLFLQLCDGLQHAHQSGVIHRDIKPGNLLVDKKGLLKIADFGLAKLNGDGASNEWQTGDCRRMGTLGYMAPEQVERPQAVDHRADIYSAGVVLYQMLTGELPMGKFPKPSEKAEVDPSLDAVLDRALEKDVALRYQNIGEFKQAVEAVVLNKKEPLQKVDRSDLQRQLRPLEKAARETPGNVHVWEQLKQVCDQLDNEEGSILASSRLAEIYRKQGRWAEAILEGQKLMLRLPKESKFFWEIKHQTHNTNILLLAYEEMAASRPAEYRLLEMLKRSYSILDIDDKREYFTRKLAEAYVHKGKWPQAISEYRELLQRHPDNDAIKKILSDLEERQREELEEAA